MKLLQIGMAFLACCAMFASAQEGDIMTKEQVDKELGEGTGLFQQDIAYEGMRVASVNVRYTTQHHTVDKSRLLDVLATKPGSKYSQATVNSDLERLVERGLVSGNTSVSVEPSGNGVSVTFLVAAHNLLGGVGATGVTAFTQNEIREESGLVVGQVLNDKAVSRALANMRRIYQEARYPDARVSYRYQRTARPGFVDLIFDVNEGKKANIVKIQFIGNAHYDSETLREVMETKEKGWLTWITKSGRIDREQLDNDFEEVLKFYRNHGYLRAQIVKIEQLAPTNPKYSAITLRITVYEGKRYKVNQVAFGPTKVFTSQELVKGLSLYNGDSYSGKKVSDDITMIRRYYGSRGYADAKVVSDIQEVGTDKEGRGLINIVYRIDEGSRYRVGNISIKGNHRSKDYVIRRELPMQSNDFLNAVDLETAEKRLQGMGYFDTVQVTQVHTATPGYRNVQVEVHEKERINQLSLGLAFSSIQSVYVYGSASFPNFDLYDWGRFSGGGQRFTVSVQLGTQTQSAMASWLDPWFLDRKLAFGVDLYYSNSTYYSDYYDQQNYGVAFSFKKALGDVDYLRFEYRLENYELNMDWDSPLFFQDHGGTFMRSHAEISYVYDTRNALVLPRKGGKFELLAGYSGLGGDVKSYNVGMNYSYYLNLKWDTILSVNGSLAAVEGTEGDKDVEIFEREYLGGPNNLRGFRYRDVGLYDPALSGSETMGGKSSFYTQFEYSIPIIEELRVAFFYDIGFVHEDAFDFKANKIASDYGIGLRINLPMGPIAVDYALPSKTGNAIDSGGRFQFYVNYAY